MLQTNKEIELAHQFLQSTKANIFLTGKAGTGKTTFLHNVVHTLHKRFVVAAPTAVAAINARGVTLHSLFQLPFGLNIPGMALKKEKAYRKMGKHKIALLKSIELLVIDEISMVRADLLDGVDRTLREVRRNSLPFGGVQLLMIGDVQQLSPISTAEEWNLLKEHYASPYFFDSNAIKASGYTPIELKTIYRQSDSNFTALLNGVRENRVTPQILEALNKRYIPNFSPKEEEGYITLSTHNHSANEINARQLALLNGEQQTYTAMKQGEYPESAYPNDMELLLKVGAQVIFIKNDPSLEKSYYNGMVATVIELNEKSVKVKPKSEERIIEVSPIKWENIEYTIDKTTSEIEERVKGWYMQLPLKCAWAITIHKSQGLTFDKVIIDATRSFAHGQVYVALSRCRSLEGMVLSSPLGGSSIISDNTVTSFNNYIEQHQPQETELEQKQREYFEHILHEIFNFAPLGRKLYTTLTLFNSHLHKEYPILTEKLQNALISCDSEITNVGENFSKQLSKIVWGCSNFNNDSFLAERLAKSAIYFGEKLQPIETLLDELEGCNPDSKEVATKLKTATAELCEELQIKGCAIKLCATTFNWQSYLKEKYLIVTKGEISSLESKKSDKKEKVKANISTDLIHPKLYQSLASWRLAEATKIEKPLFTILSNRTLLQIQALLPSTINHLHFITGLGKKRVAQFGAQIIEMVNQYGADEGIDLEEYAALGNHFAEPPKQSEPKRTKKATNQASHRVTLTMVKEGIPLDQIAAERELSLTTIYSHIAKNIKDGELPLSQFIPESAIDEIKAALANSDGTLTNTRELLNQKYDYNEIKMVASHLQREQG